MRTGPMAVEKRRTKAKGPGQEDGEPEGAVLVLAARVSSP